MENLKEIELQGIKACMAFIDLELNRKINELDALHDEGIIKEMTCIHETVEDIQWLNYTFKLMAKYKLMEKDPSLYKSFITLASLYEQYAAKALVMMRGSSIQPEEEDSLNFSDELPH